MKKTIIFYKDFGFSGFKPLFQKRMKSCMNENKVTIEFKPTGIELYTIGEKQTFWALIKVGEFIGMYQAFAASGYKLMKHFTEQ